MKVLWNLIWEHDEENIPNLNDFEGASVITWQSQYITSHAHTPTPPKREDIRTYCVYTLHPIGVAVHSTLLRISANLSVLAHKTSTDNNLAQIAANSRDC